MDFFERQAQAKRKSLVLITYFVLAVVATILVINVLAFLAARYFSQLQYVNITTDYWLSGPFWSIAALLTAIIATGSLWRYMQLRQGGSTVARMLGAKPLDMHSQQPAHRQAINITEEISIASGMPVPAIYIMDREQGINAFVAGYHLQDMTLTLSQGALDNLSRDELQGVIAHEFSHIRNADTRLNMRIIALLAGLLLIGSVGGFLCRSASLTRLGMSYRSRSGKGSAGLFAVGAALFVAGYTGLFFGRLIQSAVSRQREWLADATAVQFTRNPQGIAGALAKIADSTHHSWLQTTANAQQVNHMCFSESLKLRRWLASHPPIEHRIIAIDPMFLTRQRAARNAKKVQERQGPSTAMHSEPATSQLAAAGEPLANTAMSQNIGNTAMSPTVDNTAMSRTVENTAMSRTLENTAMSQTDKNLTMNQPARAIIGTLPTANFMLGHQLVSHFNALFGPDLHQAEYAEALLLQLLLAETSLATASMPVQLSTGGMLEDFPRKAALNSALRQLPAGANLSLLEIIVGVLKVAPEQTRRHIVNQTNLLVAADGRTTFAEFIMQTFVTCHLQAKIPTEKLTNATTAAPHLELLIAMFARLGSEGGSTGAAQQLFAKVSQLHFPLTPMTFRPKISGPMLQKAVTGLVHLNTHLKPVLIDACLDCIKADGKVIEKEYQLLRITVELLDCPMPPIVDHLAGQTLPASTSNPVQR